MTIAGKRLRVSAEGSVAAGRYNIGSPKSSQGFKIATAKIPSSAVSQGRDASGTGRATTISAGKGRATTITARKGHGETIYAGKGVAATIYAGKSRAETIYAGKQAATIFAGKNRTETIYAGQNPRTGGPIRSNTSLVDLHIVPHAHASKFRNVPTVVLKAGADELLEAMQEAGGAVLVVHD